MLLELSTCARNPCESTHEVCESSAATRFWARFCCHAVSCTPKVRVSTLCWSVLRLLPSCLPSFLAAVVSPCQPGPKPRASSNEREPSRNYVRLIKYARAGSPKKLRQKAKGQRQIDALKVPLCTRSRRFHTPFFVGKFYALSSLPADNLAHRFSKKESKTSARLDGLYYVRNRTASGISPLVGTCRIELVHEDMSVAFVRSRHFIVPAQVDVAGGIELQGNCNKKILPPEFVDTYQVNIFTHDIRRYTTDRLFAPPKMRRTHAVSNA